METPKRKTTAKNLNPPKKKPKRSSNVTEEEEQPKVVFLLDRNYINEQEQPRLYVFTGTADDIENFTMNEKSQSEAERITKLLLTMTNTPYMETFSLLK